MSGFGPYPSVACTHVSCRISGVPLWPMPAQAKAAVVGLLFAAPFVAMSWRKRSLARGLYSVVSWCVQSAGLVQLAIHPQVLAAPIAPLLQPVGVNEPQDQVARPRLDRFEKSVVVVHFTIAMCRTTNRHILQPLRDVITVPSFFVRHRASQFCCRLPLCR